MPQPAQAFSGSLHTRRDGAVLILSNHNVAARNALSPAFYAGLTQALREAAADPGVGAVVLTGAGGHFCSGGDLRRLASRRDVSREARRGQIEALHDMIRAIRACPKPVIAAVEGAAAGAGCSLALACDLLVVARNAVFSVAYVKVGLTPDGGATAFLAECVSRQVLTELCLTGERVSGERLHALGCVNRLTDAGAALTEAVTLAAQIADGPAQAICRIKALCQEAHRNTLAQQLEREAQTMVLSLESEESREGIGAFFEKRAPDYARAAKIHSGQNT